MRYFLVTVIDTFFIYLYIFVTLRRVLQTVNLQKELL